MSRRLERPGIETVAFTDDKGKAFVTISREEGASFVAPEETEEDVLDDVREELLQILNVTFKSANKWRFAMGDMPFFATMSDEAFLRRVDNGEESFRAGDILRVRLHKRQARRGTNIHVDYEVTEVLEHIRAPGQLALFVRQAEAMPGAGMSITGEGGGVAP